MPLVKIQGEMAPYACRKVCIIKAMFFICTSLAFDENLYQESCPQWVLILLFVCLFVSPLENALLTVLGHGHY